jgi:hypothetical protein
MAFQDSAGVSVGQLEVTDKVNGPLGIDGSPGSYAYSGADDLVVGDASGSRGITISTGSSDTGALYFGDAATTGLESYRGMVRYSHSSDKLELGTLSQVRATIDSSGNVGIGTASPGSYDAAADNLVVGDSSTATASGATIATVGYVQYNHGSNSLLLGTNANTRWTINSTGNLVAGANLGIDFGSGASTTLDAYEEGLWSATLTPATSGTITVDGSVNALRYTIVGRVAHIQGKLNVTAVSSPVGNFVKVSLPAAVGVPDINEESGSTAGSVVVIGAAGAMNDYTLLAIEGSDHLRIYKGTGTAPSSTAADFSGDEQVYINATYIIS